MFEGVFSEVKSQLTAPQASVEDFFSCICSTGLNNTDPGLISACISTNVTSTQDKRLSTRLRDDWMNRPH